METDAWKRHTNLLFFSESYKLSNKKKTNKQNQEWRKPRPK